MNDIITPVTPDGEIGYDQYGQFVSWEKIEEPGQETRMIGTHIADVRGKTCSICGQVWQLTGPGLRNQLRLDHMEAWAHKTCYVGHLAVTESAMLYRILSNATMAHYEMAAIGWRTARIKNEYGGAWNTPWHQISFVRYPKDHAKRRDEHSGQATAFCLKFGPRKRVYHMSLHNPGFDFSKYHPITEDDVTKEVRSGWLLVHAYTEADAQKYLSAMVKLIIENTSEP